jgi:hypothetical protein
VVLVCDGSGGRAGVDDGLFHPDAPIRVVFAGPGKDADAAIARMVIEAERRAGGKGAGDVTVVSSDKGVLASAVGPIGPKARRMTSEVFLRQLLADVGRSGGGQRRADGTLDGAEVRRWLERFGVGGTAPSSPPAGDAPKVPPPTDDLLRGIDPGDLDMGKWLGEG